MISLIERRDGLAKIKAESTDVLQVNYTDINKKVDYIFDEEGDSDVWDTNKKFSGLPKNKAVIEDVVVRNYILKQSSKSKDKYQFGIYGELLPHLMLFLPIDVYADFGYKDPIDLARQCVMSRVAYIRSRNPVLQKLTEGKYSNV